MKVLLLVIAERFVEQRLAWRMLLLGPLIFVVGVCQAGELDTLTNDIKDLKDRIQELETKGTELRDGEAHKLHPVHSTKEVKIAGGFTGIIQGTVNNERQFGGNSVQGNMSVDLYAEFPVQEDGLFLLRLDVEQGAGLTDLPPLFTNPDGNPTGTNADVETWDSSQVHLVEARYEQKFRNDFLELIFGQIDVTSFFDANNLANSETTQYIAQHFVNNATIDWGLSENFYGPGVIFISHPSDSLDISAGWFEGEGNYNDMFQNPFLIGQVNLKTGHDNHAGSYRFYLWTRQTPHCQSASDPAKFLDCSLLDPADRITLKSENTGVGMSIDQRMSPQWGIWARAGYQDPDVSQFDRSFRASCAASRPRST